MSKLDGVRWKVTTLLARSGRQWRLDLGRGVSFLGHSIVRGAEQGEIVVGGRVAWTDDQHGMASGVRTMVILLLMTADPRLDTGNDCGLSGRVGCGTSGVVIDGQRLFRANIIVLNTNLHDPELGRRTYDLSEQPRISTSIWIGDDACVGSCLIWGQGDGQGTTDGDGSAVKVDDVVISGVPAFVVAAGSLARAANGLLAAVA